MFSLSALRDISEDGVRFQSHLDGSTHFLSPEIAVDIQTALGSDIMMILDDCLAYPASHFDTDKSMKRSLAWAERCHRHWKQLGAGIDAGPPHALFGIVQGGIYPDLRKESAERLVAMDFPGYAIGGLAVGEPKPSMYEIIEQVEPYLPEEKPRYLMGVGTPADLVEAVALRRGYVRLRHAHASCAEWMAVHERRTHRHQAREIQGGSGADRCRHAFARSAGPIRGPT